MRSPGGRPSGLPHRPRLKPTTEVLHAADGQIYLLRPGDDYAISDTPLARALLAHLAGETEREELPGALAREGIRVGRDDLDEALRNLQDQGLLEDASGDDGLAATDRTRYEGQLRYFADLAPPGAARAHYQARLRASRVAVIGLGGLGCWAAYALASAGVGQLDLIDGDVVELGNLNRQILYRERSIGERKAEAAAAALSAFNSTLDIRAVDRRLEDESDVEDVVAHADLVVDAADWPPHEIEHWVNSVCFRLGIPYLTMSLYPPVARVGPTYVPGQSGCLVCQESALRGEFPLFDELARQRARQPSEAATFGPACGLIGSVAATEVVHLLSGIAAPASLGAALVFDLRTMEMRREPVFPEPSCAVCAAG